MPKGIDTKILKEIPHDNYLERIENWQLAGQNDPPTKMRNAYNHQGQYIGDLDTAKVLCEKFGIIPEVIDPEHQVCSIGYSPKYNKWYGWSHRAITGFKIGDKIFETNFGDDNTPFINHGTKTIKSMKDARLAAARFAKSVSADQWYTTTANWVTKELITPE